MKKGKKILVSLTAALLLSTSMGHARGFNYTIKTNFSYNNQYNGGRYVLNYNNYSSNYLRNGFGNIIRIRPIFNWDYSDIKEPEQERPEQERPEQEKPEQEKPEQEKPEQERPEQENPIDANTSIEKEVVRLVNIEREKAGLAPFTYSEELSKVARVKSKDMADNNYFSHNSPTYGDPFAMMREFGINYSYAGENIAKGYFSAESVVRGWMNSTGHRENILNPSFGTIGVGYVESNGTTYWTQMFTN